MVRHGRGRCSYAWKAVAARNASLDACHSDEPVLPLPLLVIAIVVQAVLLAFCVMAYRLTTGEEVAQENITVALLAFVNAARVPKQQDT